MQLEKKNQKSSKIDYQIKIKELDRLKVINKSRGIVMMNAMAKVDRTMERGSLILSRK